MSSILTIHNIETLYTWDGRTEKGLPVSATINDDEKTLVIAIGPRQMKMTFNDAGWTALRTTKPSDS